MKLIATLLTLSFFGASASAQSTCSTGLAKEKAECVLRAAIASRANAEIARQIADFEAHGLTMSGEVSTTFVGGDCTTGGACSYNYIVSADFASGGSFKTVTALINSWTSDVAPTIRRVFLQTELR